MEAQARFPHPPPSCPRGPCAVKAPSPQVRQVWFCLLLTCGAPWGLSEPLLLGGLKTLLALTPPPRHGACAAGLWGQRGARTSNCSSHRSTCLPGPRRGDRVLCPLTEAGAGPPRTPMPPRLQAHTCARRRATLGTRHRAACSKQSGLLPETLTSHDQTTQNRFYSNANSSSPLSSQMMAREPRNDTHTLFTLVARQVAVSLLPQQAPDPAAAPAPKPADEAHLPDDEAHLPDGTLIGQAAWAPHQASRPQHCRLNCWHFVTPTFLSPPFP